MRRRAAVLTRRRPYSQARLVCSREGRPGQNMDSIPLPTQGYPWVSDLAKAKSVTERGRPAAPLTASGQAQRRITALRRARHVSPRRAWSGDRNRLRCQHTCSTSSTPSASCGFTSAPAAWFWHGFGGELDSRLPRQTIRPRNPASVRITTVRPRVLECLVLEC